MATCLIYYYSYKTRQSVLHNLSEIVGKPVAKDEFVYTLDYGEEYFGIHLNETAAGKNEKIDQGDYRSFPYYIDIDTDDEDSELVAVVKKVLEYFWLQGEAAVAQCSFEDQLPFFGGYKKEDMEWPQHGIEI